MSERLAAAKAAREARKAALQLQIDEQAAIDLEAINDLEILHGDQAVHVIEVPYVDGLPTRIACRCPNRMEVERYRAMVKVNAQGVAGDRIKASEALASVTLIYPDADTYTKLCEARPGLHSQLGQGALVLAVGRADEDVKG